MTINNERSSFKLSPDLIRSSGKKLEENKVNTPNKRNPVLSDLLSFPEDQTKISYLNSAKKVPVKIDFYSDNLLPDSFKAGKTLFLAKNQKELSSGINYSEYHPQPFEQKKIIRTILFDPRNNELFINYGKKTFSSLAKDNIVAAVNGVTMVNYLAQGDIKGIDAQGNISVYQLKNNQSAANARYSIAITREGNVEFVRGGLNGNEPRVKSHRPENYKYFINGAALLFDREKFTDEKEFNDKFSDRHDSSMLKNMRPESDVPRTAIGITKEGKVMLLTFGEGNNRWEKGATGFEMYQALKAMGAEKALMLDGGGAPAMITKDEQGKTSITKPDEKKGYGYNASFLAIRKN